MQVYLFFGISPELADEYLNGTAESLCPEYKDLVKVLLLILCVRLYSHGKEVIPRIPLACAFPHS